MRVRTSVRMASSLPHISYPRFKAALRARDLPFILRHSERTSMGPRDEIDVCELIAEKDPQHLLPGSAEFPKQEVVDR
jgi:hypothetical protein